MNVTTGKPFNDRSAILYVNGEYDGDDALGYLMHGFRCADPDKCITERWQKEPGISKKIRKE